MFSSAFKSFTSNITSNYEITKQPTATSGAWTIFDAKKKSTGAQASVFVFERKLLDLSSSTNSGFGARTSSTSIRKVQDEVVERLKKEASSLARLRHPSILQLVEPVEDTRSGGLMFATEPVISSLSGALAQKDRNERTSNGRRDTRDYGASPASRTSQEVDLDELEIQKGLLQVAKGLEFLHDSAKLVHGNLTPDAIFINAKSDWKISGLSFAGPPNGAEGHQPAPQISLSEVLYHDARIPPTVQLNLDYTSPDFVMDNNINFAADVFSLGLLLLACYSSPHTSPVETHGNQSTYKKIFSSPSTAPSPRNNWLCSTKLPSELEQVLPRILARQPSSRMNATEFQQSAYFDNILVNTMRFLDGLPAKTATEKSQFMRGLARVMPQFPVSVLGKKILSVLLDELKDRDLLSVILQNIFLILKAIPNRKDALSDKVLPRLRDIFLAKSKTEERDTSKEAGLVVFLEHIQLVAENTTAKQFKDDALPIVHVAMESTTHSLVDTALHTLGVILPVLDFSTVKHDLFPVIANVFSKTNSLGIKVRGLEALGVLCGASDDRSAASTRGNDDLNGLASPSSSIPEASSRNTSSLDKFTMQEKVVPLLKGIKTKEPAVMMAALPVFQQIGKTCDTDFLAMEVMPILWIFALGPLLNLVQFKGYMDTIRSFSGRIEREQLRKLQELSSNSGPTATRSETLRTKSSSSLSLQASSTSGVQDDFEKLVLGGRGPDSRQDDPFAGATGEAQTLRPNPPTFSWSSGTGSTPASRTTIAPMQPSQPISRSITPDVQMTAFQPLQPMSPSTSFVSAPALQPYSQPQQNTQRLQSMNYISNSSLGAASPPPAQPQMSSSNIWSPQTSAVSPPPMQPSTNFTPMLAPPPKSSPVIQQQQQQQRQPNYTSFNSTMTTSLASMNTRQPQLQTRPFQGNVQQPLSVSQLQQPQQQKQGLDKYQSLL